MKTNIKIKSYLVLLLIGIVTLSNGQVVTFDEKDSKTEDLNIHRAFTKYKTQTRTTMTIQAQKKEYFFKSIMVEEDKEASDYIKSCVLKDKENAKSVKEVLSSGKTSTILLRLTIVDELFRFILFNTDGSTTTLVYVESNNKNILEIILEKE